MLENKYRNNPLIRRHHSLPQDDITAFNCGNGGVTDDSVTYRDQYLSDTSVEGHPSIHPHCGGTDDGYSSTSSRTHHNHPQKEVFWKMSGLSRFCIAPVKYRIQKLEALGLDTSKKSQPDARLSPQDSSPKDSLQEPPIHKASNQLTQSMNDAILTKTNTKVTKPSSDKSNPTEGQNPITSQPLAFTIDLESAASDSSGSSVPAGGKRLDITASISQWAPKHRRNQSLSKVEENKKVEERTGGQEKPPLGRPRSGTVGTGLPPRKGGYHSEGYFSSDQEDDAGRRTELKSPRSPRCAEANMPAGRSAHAPVTKTMSLDLQKVNSSRMRPPSPSAAPGAPLASPPSPYSSVPLNEQASFLIEKMLQATPELKRKQPSKPEVRQCCKERERKPSVSELTGKTYKSDRGF